MFLDLSSQALYWIESRLYGRCSLSVIYLQTRMNESRSLDIKHCILQQGVAAVGNDVLRGIALTVTDALFETLPCRIDHGCCQLVGSIRKSLCKGGCIIDNTRTDS